MLMVSQHNGFNAIGTRIPQTDPFFANVVLLCGFNGADASTTFVDESSAAHTLTGGNTAQLDTAEYVFGPSSLLVDGALDWVTSADSADWHKGAGDFTDEGRFRFASNTTLMALFGQWNTAGNQRSWMLTYRGADATDILRFDYSTNGSTGVAGVASSAWTPTVGQWYAICVERSGNVFRIYVDGVMLGSQTAAVTLFDSTSDLRIGSIVSSAGDPLEFAGHIDEFRLTKGVARYASDGGYSVATSPFPRS